MADQPRFRRIDSTNIGDHYHLTPDDLCYFLFEYTAQKKYDYSATNNLISNLKRKPGSSSFAELRYKAGAIQQCAEYISSAVNRDNLPGWTIVPIPPSKQKGDPAYDDRLLRVCKLIGAPAPLDIRELVVQSQSTVAAHEAAPGQRPTLDDLLAIYSVDESIAQPPPKSILLIDDVLTPAPTTGRCIRCFLCAFPASRYTRCSSRDGCFRQTKLQHLWVASTYFC